jgi:CheY-like chemotaxis protein
MQTANQKIILIVEDDRDIREAITELLEGEGYTIWTAGDGDKALAVLAKQLPDLILLDLMMPNKDGFEFRREQMSDPRIAGIPVVIMTADSNIENKKANMLANDFIKKPLEIDAALATISKALNL